MSVGPTSTSTQDREPSLTRAVLDLALPAIGTGFLAVAYHWVNQGWVNRLDADGAGAAALATAVFFVWALHGTVQLVVTGLTALVARYLGARRDDAAAYVALQGIRWAWLLALTLAVVGNLVAPWILDRIRIEGDARAHALAYVRVAYAGGIGWATVAACDAVFRAHGDTKTSLLLQGTALLANALLDPLLIYGAGPVPGLGVAGAAVATVLCWSGAGLAGLAILSRRGFLSRRHPGDDALRFRDDTPLRRGRLPGVDLSVGRRVARVGLPHFAQSLFFVAIYFELSRIVIHAGGQSAQAGLGQGLRGEQIAFVLCGGFSVAASVLVGRNLGAARPQRAERSAWRAAVLAAAACGAWGLCLAFLGGAVAWLLQIPDAVRPYALAYFTIVSVSLVPQAFEIVLDGAFAGAGATLPPMIVSITMAAARIPLATWAAFDLGLGVAGVWWVIALTAALRGVVIAVWFSLGRWQTHAV